MLAKYTRQLPYTFTHGQFANKKRASDLREERATSKTREKLEGHGKFEERE